MSAPNMLISLDIMPLAPLPWRQRSRGSVKMTARKSQRSRKTAPDKKRGVGRPRFELTDERLEHVARYLEKFPAATAAQIAAVLGCGEKTLRLRRQEDPEDRIGALIARAREKPLARLDSYMESSAREGSAAAAQLLYRRLGGFSDETKPVDEHTGRAGVNLQLVVVAPTAEQRAAVQDLAPDGELGALEEENPDRAPLLPGSGFLRLRPSDDDHDPASDDDHE